MAKLNKDAPSQSPVAVPNLPVLQFQPKVPHAKFLSRESSPSSVTHSSVADSLDTDLQVNLSDEDDLEVGVKNKVSLMNEKEILGEGTLDQELAEQMDRDPDLAKRISLSTLVHKRQNVDMFADTDIFSEDYQVGRQWNFPLKKIYLTFL
jgi:hypothetical protein